MSFNNTIILSEDNAAQAKIDFDAALQNDKITVIIFGNTEKSGKAATIADALAALVTSGFHRQVIWIKNNAQWDELKGSLANGAIQVNSIVPNQSICASISLSNKTEYCIDTSKTADNIVMTLAFIQASKA